MWEAVETGGEGVLDSGFREEGGREMTDNGRKMHTLNETGSSCGLQKILHFAWCCRSQD
jgi:hypothetical protein